VFYKARTILFLICLTVLFASFVGAQEKQSSDLSVAKSNSDTVLLTEGVGVENIVIDKSRADDVIKSFGKKFSLIKTRRILKRNVLQKTLLIVLLYAKRQGKSYF
jgi:hypothetical protein